MNFPSSAGLELSQPMHTDFILAKIACVLQEKKGEGGSQNEDTACDSGREQS